MAIALPQDPIPTRTVHLVVPREVAFSLEKIQKVTVNLLGRLGCPQCHSGFDIRFIQERDFIADPRTLEVHGLPVGRL